MSTLELHPLSPCQICIINRRKKRLQWKDKTKTDDANKYQEKRKKQHFLLVQPLLSLNHTSTVSKLPSKARGEQDCRQMTLLSGCEDASDVPFDMVYFKGNDSNFWLSFEKQNKTKQTKKRLVVELFQRHETESSSFDHETTNSNTSLLEKSKNLQFCVSAGYGVREKKHLFTLQFPWGFRGVWRHQ